MNTHRSAPQPPVSSPASPIHVQVTSYVKECERRGLDWKVVLLGLSRGMVHNAFSLFAGVLFQVETHMVHFLTRGYHKSQYSLEMRK